MHSFQKSKWTLFLNRIIEKSTGRKHKSMEEVKWEIETKRTSRKPASVCKSPRCVHGFIKILVWPLFSESFRVKQTVLTINHSAQCLIDSNFYRHALSLKFYEVGNGKSRDKGCTVLAYWMGRGQDCGLTLSPFFLLFITRLTFRARSIIWTPGSLKCQPPIGSWSHPRPHGLVVGDGWN